MSWFLFKSLPVGRIEERKVTLYAVVTTTIRLRLDGRSTAYQRSLRSQ